MVIRFTPKGLLVSAAVSAISISKDQVSLLHEAITPKPPALDNAETKLRSDTQVMAPPNSAYSVPRNVRPRAHKALSFLCAAIIRDPALLPHRARKLCAESQRQFGVSI